MRLKKGGLPCHPVTGESFLKNILEVGGTRDAMDAFVAFRGRKPKIDALLRLSGMEGESA